MPGRFERHRRTKWDWGLPPSRSEEVREAASADPEPAKRAPGRKDTRHWCKGKTGVEHAPALTLTEDPVAKHGKECRWAPQLDYAAATCDAQWSCRHREICQRCGKVLRENRDLRPEECPAYPGTAEQRAGAKAEAVKVWENWQARAARWRRKPVITGPQGYRRNRV